MHFKIDHIEIKITWQHDTSVPRPLTICTIEIANGIDVKLYHANCLVGKKDKFSRNKGRKRALGRALQKVWSRQTTDGLANRRIVWEHYRMMTDKPRWEV